MKRQGAKKIPSESDPAPYILDRQVGFLFRTTSRRYEAALFAAVGSELTPSQLLVVLKLNEVGACTQNQLGRLTSMDGATVKGVVDRLTSRRLARRERDPTDIRRIVVKLTVAGVRLAARVKPKAVVAARATLAPLPPKDQVLLVDLLKRLL